MKFRRGNPPWLPELGFLNVLINHPGDNLMRKPKVETNCSAGFQPAITWVRFCLSIILFSFAFPLSIPAKEEITEIVKQVQPSVVVITTYDEAGKALGQGSGFFVGKDGQLITNRHVLYGASHAQVKTADGKEYPIQKIIAEDKEGDLIRFSIDIPPNVVSPLTISGDTLEVGAQVVVIGNPLGLEKTVTDGIVSAVREIPSFGKIVQISAPISPGSSGSPVVNRKGEVIGVATFLLREGQNLNFAVPSERIAKLKSDKGKAIADWKKGQAEEWLSTAEGLLLTGLSYFLQDNGDGNIAIQFEKALPFFKNAIKKNPDYAEAHYYVGFCFGILGRYNEAIEAYKQAIRLKSDFAEAHCNLGVAYGKLGRYKEEIEALKQAIRLEPDDADAHNNLGAAYFNLGRFNEAIEAYKQAIRLKPDLAEAHVGLGLVYDKLGRYNEAIEAFKQAIRLKPDLANAHCGLGKAYGKLGRYDETIEAYKQAIRLKPDYAEAYIDLGMFYVILGRFNEALEACKKAIQLKPDYDLAHISLGLAYGSLGRYNEAIEAYKNAIRLKPDDALAHYELGSSYLHINNKGLALKEYKILKELEPLAK